MDQFRQRHPSNLRQTLILAASLLVSLTILDADTLQTKSPFLPPGHGAETTEETVAPQAPPGVVAREVEFRGVVQFGNEYQFSLFDKRDQKGYWIRLNETRGGITVRSYDSSEMTVAVSKGGRTERITLLEATENPLPVPAATVAAQPTPPQPQAQPPNPQQTIQSKARTVPRRRVILPKR